MPKRGKQKASSTRNRGPVSHWPTHKRLEYHLAEASVHLMMIEQILQEDMKNDHDFMEILEHRVQAGRRLRVLWKLCRKTYPDMMEQP